MYALVARSYLALRILIAGESAISFKRLNWEGKFRKPYQKGNNDTPGIGYWKEGLWQLNTINMDSVSNRTCTEVLSNHATACTSTHQSGASVHTTRNGMHIPPTTTVQQRGKNQVFKREIFQAVVDTCYMISPQQQNLKHCRRQCWQIAPIVLQAICKPGFLSVCPTNCFETAWNKFQIGSSQAANCQHVDSVHRLQA